MIYCPPIFMVGGFFVGEFSVDVKERVNEYAILVMCFGTTYKESRQKNIEVVADKIAKTNPQAKVIIAFTSHIVIERIKVNEGVLYPTPEKALNLLKTEGYTRIALVSLDIIPGIEYEYNCKIFELAKQEFKNVSLGAPLLYWQGQRGQRDDIAQFIKAISKDIKINSQDEAVLLMAHGTLLPSNAYYSVIQVKLNEMGYDNVYVYTVEGWPLVNDIIPKLKSKNIVRIRLLPIMLVAGMHAVKDMVGEEPYSHINMLKREGFNVTFELKGLGENPIIQEMFVQRANEAVGALN